MMNRFLLGRRLEVKPLDFEATMLGSTDSLPAGSAPIDGEMIQMMCQQQGQQQEIPLRLQALEDASAFL